MSLFSTAGRTGTSGLMLADLSQNVGSNQSQNTKRNRFVHYVAVGDRYGQQERCHGCHNGSRMISIRNRQFGSAVLRRHRTVPADTNGSIDFGVRNAFRRTRSSGSSTPADSGEAKARLFAPPGDFSLFGYITLQFLDCGADVPDKAAELRLRGECRWRHLSVTSVEEIFRPRGYRARAMRRKCLSQGVCQSGVLKQNHLVR